MAAPDFVAAGAAVSATSAATLTPLYPAGHLVGQTAFLVLSSDGVANHTLSTASGFVEITNSPQSAASGIPHTQVWWCPVTSTSMPSPVIADSANDSQKIAFIMTFTGCEQTGNPWDVTAGDTSTTSTSVAVPGGTTTGPDRLIVAICGHSIDIATGQSSGEANADLTSVTERVDVSTALGNGNGIVVITGVKATAGTFGTTTCTLATTSEQARIMIALKPPTGASAGTMRSRLLVTDGTFRTGVLG